MAAPWNGWKRGASRQQVGLRHGFRSGLEEQNAQHITKHGQKVVFEQVKVRYVVPQQERTYTPDFELGNGVIVETKGRYVAVDRAKHLYIRLCHPGLDIRFVFQNPNARISKGSATTYAMWAERHGFKWAKKLIPVEWMEEKPRDPNGPRGARTIEVPPEKKDFFADPPRQPHAARSRAPRRSAAVAGQKARTP